MMHHHDMGVWSVNTIRTTSILTEIICCNKTLWILNIFFEHCELHRYTWNIHRLDLLCQRTRIDFCIVLDNSSDHWQRFISKDTSNHLLSVNSVEEDDRCLDVSLPLPVWHSININQTCHYEIYHCYLWFYPAKWYQKLLFRDIPLFSRLDAPLLPSTSRIPAARRGAPSTNSLAGLDTTLTCVLSQQTPSLPNLWRMGNIRLGAANSPGLTTSSCPTYWRSEHLR